MRRDALSEQVSRTRLCIAATQRRIARSQQRIDAALRAIAPSRLWFGAPNLKLTIDQAAQALEFTEAVAEQRQIDLEVRRTATELRGEV